MTRSAAISRGLPAQVAGKKYIDYVSSSDGQTLLQLMDRRLDIYKAYYGDPTGQYQRAKNLIYQASKDLHGVSPTFTGLLSPVEQTIAGKIKIASKQTRGFLGNNFNANKSLIPKLNCNQVENQGRIEYGRENPPPDRLDYGYDQAEEREYERRYSEWENEASRAGRAARVKCEREQKFRDILNQEWEAGSHHALYEFITPSQIKGLTNTALSLGKVGKHKGYINGISSLTGISRANLREWTENGILSNNAGSDVGLLTPQETIEQLRLAQQDHENGDTRDSVGFGVTEVLLIIALVKLLIGGIAATIALKKKMKQETTVLQQQIESMGFKNVSADRIDHGSFSASSGGGLLPDFSGGNTTGLLIGGAAVAGIAYYLSKK